MLHHESTPPRSISLSSSFMSPNNETAPQFLKSLKFNNHAGSLRIDRKI